MGVHHNKASKRVAIGGVESFEFKGESKIPNIGFSDTVFAFRRAITAGFVGEANVSFIFFAMPVSNETRVDNFILPKINNMKSLFAREVTQVGEESVAARITVRLGVGAKGVDALHRYQRRDDFRLRAGNGEFDRGWYNRGSGGRR